MEYSKLSNAEGKIHNDTTMNSFFSTWWDNRIIRRSHTSQQLWNQSIERLPILDNLSTSEKQRLVNLSVLFLHYKSLEGAQGLIVNQDMAHTIALQACLPILQLGINWYDGWRSVIIYPSQYIADRTEIDSIGVIHQQRSVLAGEAWQRGPVVLAWDETSNAAIIDGHNLVIHEFAHKLDVLNGSSNGFPPLHREMNIEKWSCAMSQAYDHFCELDTPPFSAYAATSPAEFFAVVCEVFFEKPALLNHLYREIYQQYCAFFRQNPLTRERQNY